MKITAVTPIPVTVELGREPMSFSFVRIETDEGLVGYGEACDSYAATYAGVIGEIITQVLSPLLVGREFVVVEPVVEHLRLATRRRLGEKGVAAHARSAVEIALWDLVAQAAGRSVSEQLGQVRDRVNVYASSTFLDEGPAQFHADLLAPLLERGVRYAKVRVGPRWQQDLRTLTELRDLLPDDLELMIDGSDTFTLPTAMQVAERLGDLGIRWFEEPIPQANRAAIAALSARSSVPIAYGEHLYGREDMLDALANDGISVVQPDASTCGIAEARAVAGIATFYGARVVPHICAGPVALAANLAVAASVHNINLVEYPFFLEPAWEALGGGKQFGIEAIEDGSLAVPSGPGLGVRLPEDAATTYPYRLPGTRIVGTVGGVLDRFVGDR
ncbi:mandelate racemase/muconate lactonizing enzyme family protein [Cryptosporangium phraense]|uniref:Mandelate racemase/muconate lactonizing enzyme family protein n=1 Tax=Cryptosporangium phraense TaxID=2593070 RepID=A0A545AIM3_9ACTN|nr:mandelate racemase/muconate lactonizing enzyme family protein [Cryptosporangium phraense]TQS41172.1 mandelate racemase/muconate lactonizing enzyme family protein [Cryptosporangium phraense]